MKPVSPILEGYEKYEVVYAKDQPPYLPLPTVPIGDFLLTRWKLTWRERLAALFGRDFFLWVMTCNKPLQPLRLSFERRGGLKDDYFAEGV